jgi:hypothetical protein
MKNITYEIAGETFTAEEMAEITADLERYELEQELEQAEANWWALIQSETW